MTTETIDRIQQSAVDVLNFEQEEVAITKADFNELITAARQLERVMSLPMTFWARIPGPVLGYTIGEIYDTFTLDENPEPEDPASLNL